jgi:EAL domain-containing protein (putative c-di-GMP-specific phosphodiesterase class I)
MEFIPAAEDNGLILKIGLWVLESACQQLKTWEGGVHTQHLHLAVNVSARQFYQVDFVAQVTAIIKKTAIDPSKLELELTETLVLDNILDAIKKMTQLNKLGIKFSIDDFGTGYSSLAYLTQLPLTFLKIDKTFVHNIGLKPTDAVIVQTIIGMAKNLGMSVIAEGVETNEQLAFLALNGCHLYQGFLFSKPIPLLEFEQLLLLETSSPRPV